MYVVAMPQMGETVTEGTITGWAVAVGDRVEVDSALFEVSTEKIDTEVPAAEAGYVRAVLVEAGETVPVGTALAVVTPGPDDPFDLSDLPGARPGAQPLDPLDEPRVGPGGMPAGAGTNTGAVSDGDPVEGGGWIRADGPDGRATGDAATDREGGARPAPVSPVVARLLAEHGLDPATVPGSGRRGRITRADVLAAATAATQHAGPAGTDRPAGWPRSSGSESLPGSGGPAAHALEVTPGDEVLDFSKARAATAEHMRRSLSTAAHALVVVEVDYQNVESVRRSLGLSYLPFVARAVIEALRRFPHLNASVDGDRLIVRRRVRLGVAVDLDQEALVVPVVHEADDLRLPALGAAIADVADRARRRRLAAPELEGGTFTVTNVGAYGTVMAVPIINQPQVAILSTDGVRMKPVAVRTGSVGGGGPDEWGVAIRPVGNLSLSFDHRAVDGAYAAAFLAAVRDLVEGHDWVREL